MLVARPSRRTAHQHERASWTFSRYCFWVWRSPPSGAGSSSAPVREQARSRAEDLLGVVEQLLAVLGEHLHPPGRPFLIGAHDVRNGARAAQPAGEGGSELG